MNKRSISFSSNGRRILLWTGLVSLALVAAVHWYISTLRTSGIGFGTICIVLILSLGWSVFLPLAHVSNREDVTRLALALILIGTIFMVGGLWSHSALEIYLAPYDLLATFLVLDSMFVVLSGVLLLEFRHGRDHLLDKEQCC